MKAKDFVSNEWSCRVSVLLFLKQKSEISMLDLAGYITVAHGLSVCSTFLCRTVRFIKLEKAYKLEMVGQAS